MNLKEIVLLQTNKGIVAIENNQVFDLWKTKPLIMILNEIQIRYPNYKISIGGLICFQYEQAVLISSTNRNRAIEPYQQ